MLATSMCCWEIGDWVLQPNPGSLHLGYVLLITFRPQLCDFYDKLLK